MEKFIKELQDKYNIDDITGYLGSVLEQVAGNIDTNDYNFLEDLYNMATREDSSIKVSSTEKKYVVTELIGNYDKTVFKSDNFYEVQDYMADRWEKYCEENDIDPSDEKESELFHSYFSIQEIDESPETSENEKFFIVDYPYFVSKTGTVTTLKSKEFQSLSYDAFLKRLLKSDYVYLFDSEKDAEKYISKLTDSDNYKIISTKRIVEVSSSSDKWNWKFEKTRKGIRLVGTQGNQKVVFGYDGQMETFYTEVTRDVTLPYDMDNHEYIEGFIDTADAAYSLREWHETDNTEHVLVDNFEYPAEEINKFHQLVKDIYFGDITYKTHEEALDHEMRALQELDELEHGKIGKSTKTSSKTFEDNLDLMTEFLQIKDVKDWDKFVSKHPSISDNDMDDTNAKITPEVLADLFRQAENAYQDEMNGRETDLNVTSEEAKDAISSYVYNSGYLSKSEQKEFEDLCNAMGC